MKKVFSIAVFMLGLLISSCESMGDVLGAVNQGINASMSGSSSSGSSSYRSNSSSSSSISNSSSSSDDEYKTLTFNCTVPVSCDYYDFDYNQKTFSYSYYTTITTSGYTEENCKKSAASLAYSEASGDAWNELQKRSDYNSKLKANEHIGTPTATRAY